MANSKHIFVQLDTKSIILGYEGLLLEELNKEEFKAAVSKLTKMHSMIYTQGSMAMGNPTKEFTVDVDLSANVYFTILPIELFTYSHLYFIGFKCNGEEPITRPELSPQEPHVSFTITCDEEGDVDYKLRILLNYIDLVGVEQSIILSLDPRLRIRQTGG